MTVKIIKDNLPYRLVTKDGFDQKVSLQVRQWTDKAESHEELCHFNSVGGLLGSKQAESILQEMEELEGEQYQDTFKNKVAVSFENNPRLGFAGCKLFIDKMLKANSIFAHLNLASTGLTPHDINAIAGSLSMAEPGARISLNLSGSNKFDDVCVQSILNLLEKPAEGVEIQLRLPKVPATVRRQDELGSYGVTFAKNRSERVADAVSPGLSIQQKEMINRIVLEALRGATESQLRGIAEHVQQGLGENHANLEGIQNMAAEDVDDFHPYDQTGQNALSDFVGQTYGKPDTHLPTKAEFIQSLSNGKQREEAHQLFTLFEEGAQIVLGGAAAINPAIDNAFAAQHHQGEAVLDVMAGAVPVDDDDPAYGAAESGFFARRTEPDNAEAAIGKTPDKQHQTTLVEASRS
jgi:hypothetical protein